MTKIILYVNKARKQANGNYAIYVATIVQRTPVRFNTGVAARLDCIDFKNGYLRGKSSEINDKNLIIENCRARINDIFVRYRLRFADLTPALLRREYENYTQNFLFYDFALAKLEQHKILLSEGRIRIHRSILNKINTFAPKCYLNDINEDFIMRLTAYCRKHRCNCNTTIANALKILSLYWKLAKKEGLVQGNPFESNMVRPNTAVREYLTPDELRKLVMLYKANTLSSTHQNVLRYFLFSCMTGLRFSDVAACTHNNIVGDTLVVQMQKTKNVNGKAVKIPITDGVRQLINDGGARLGEPLFRVITDQRTNIYLREVIAMAGIPKHISFHCGRHTFATNFLLANGEKIATLQELLGHTKIEQTPIYAHVLYEDTAQSMHFFNAIFNG